MIREDRLPREIRFVAGLDAAYDAGRGRVAAAVVLMDASSMRTVERAAVPGRVEFPYVPGLFAFRELPPLMDALRNIRGHPDLVLCDAQGIAHPRRFGLACHVGVLYDIPAIGCAKTRLTGQSGVPGEARGSSCNLTDAGETVGAVLRTQAGVKPVYVSVGHRISLETACRWVLRLAPRYRIPEPLRAANRLARESLAAAFAGQRR